MSSLTERYAAFAAIGKNLDGDDADDGSAQNSAGLASLAGALDGSALGTDVLEKLQTLASVVKRASELVSRAHATITASLQCYFLGVLFKYAD